MDRQQLPQPKTPVKPPRGRAPAVQSIDSIYRSASAETRLAPLINDPHILTLVLQVIRGERDWVVIHEDIECTEREVLAIAAARGRGNFTLLNGGKENAR